MCPVMGQSHSKRRPSRWKLTALGRLATIRTTVLSNCKSVVRVVSPPSYVCVWVGDWTVDDTLFAIVDRRVLLARTRSHKSESCSRAQGRRRRRRRWRCPAVERKKNAHATGKINQGPHKLVYVNLFDYN